MTVAEDKDSGQGWDIYTYGLGNKGGLVMQVKGKITMVLSTTLFGSLLIFQLTPADFSRNVYDRGIAHFERCESTPERYSQNSEKEYWEKFANPNFPLTLIDWQLVTSPQSGDKYMNKVIIGKVKNNSKEEFSAVKIEFTVYDEEGTQIAVVFSNVYDFKPGHIWKFEIPVTSDVGKAELKGLYVASRT
jgi:hypothetical protein